MLNKLNRLIISFGYRVTAAYLLHRLLQKLSKSSGCYYYYIYEQELTQHKQAQALRAANSKLAFNWYQDFDDIHLQLPRPESVLKERFNQKTSCVMAIQEQEVTACAWFTESSYQEDEVRCTFDFSHLPNHVWDYDVYVIPKYRVGRLFLRLWRQVEMYWQDKGKTASLSRISAFNQNSVTSHEKLGAKRLASACFLCVGNIQLMVSSTAPYINLSCSTNSRPTIKVNLI